MAGKRKRKRASRDEHAQSKKRNKLDAKETCGNASIQHPTLCLYYPRVVTLKDYLISKVPASAVSRREKITSVGKGLQRSLKVNQSVLEGDAQQVSSPSTLHVKPEGSRKKNLAKLLETTLVGLPHETPSDIATSREKDFVSFSQQVSLLTGSSVEEVSTTQSEVGFPDLY